MRASRDACVTRSASFGAISRARLRPLRRSPVPADPPPAAAAPKAKSAAHLRPLARAAVPAARAAAGLEPFDRRLKQRLARGTESIDARIDLHGRTQSEAHAALLSSCARRRAMAPSSSW